MLIYRNIFTYACICTNIFLYIHCFCSVIFLFLNLLIDFYLLIFDCVIDCLIFVCLFFNFIYLFIYLFMYVCIYVFIYLLVFYLWNLILFLCEPLLVMIALLGFPKRLDNLVENF